MIKRDLNRLVMLKATINFLRQNESKWSDSAPISQILIDIEAEIQQIEKLQLEIDPSGAGLVKKKQTLQDALIAETFELSSMLMVLSKGNNDEVLKAKVDFPVSVLQNFRDSELSIKSSMVLTLARANADAMVAFGFTAERLDALETQITTYTNYLPEHRSSVAERKSANEMIKTLLNKGVEIANEQLDRLMVKYKSANPEFYGAYTNARKLVDYGTRHEKPVETPTPAPTA